MDKVEKSFVVIGVEMKKVVLSAAACAIVFSADAKDFETASLSNKAFPANAFNCFYVGVGLGGSFLKSNGISMKSIRYVPPASSTSGGESSDSSSNTSSSSSDTSDKGSAEDFAGDIIFGERPIGKYADDIAFGERLFGGAGENEGNEAQNQNGTAGNTGSTAGNTGSTAGNTDGTAGNTDGASGNSDGASDQKNTDVAAEEEDIPVKDCDASRFMGSVVFGVGKVVDNIYGGLEFSLNMMKNKKFNCVFVEEYDENKKPITSRTEVFEMKGFSPQITAKVGYSFTPDTIVFGKFGCIWTRATIFDPEKDKSISSTKASFSLGAGAEKIFRNGFSTGLEIDHNFGGKWGAATINKGTSVRFLLKYNMRY